MEANVNAPKILSDAGIPVAFKSDHPVLNAVSKILKGFLATTIVLLRPGMSTARPDARSPKSLPLWIR